MEALQLAVQKAQENTGIFDLLLSGCKPCASGKTIVFPILLQVRRRSCSGSNQGKQSTSVLLANIQPQGASIPEINL